MMIVSRKRLFSGIYTGLVVLLMFTACQGAPRQDTPSPLAVTDTPPAEPAPITSPDTRSKEENRVTQTPSAFSVESVTPSPSPPQVEVEASAALLPVFATDAQSLPDAPRYQITASLDWRNLSYRGHQELVYTNAEETALDIVYLRLLPNGGGSYGQGSLSVSDVQVNGETAQTELSEGNSVLAIALPGSLAPGETVQISMDFQGQVPQGFTGGYGIFSYNNDVMSLASWYPILAVYDEDGWNLDPVSAIGDSVYSDTAFYEVALTVPTDLVVAATGVGSAQPAGDGRVIYEFTSGPVRDFFWTASPRFEVLTGSVDGTTVNAYYLRGEQAGAGLALDVAAESLAVFNERIGQYPYTELDVVAVPLRYAAGVEYPGIILIGASMYGMGDETGLVVTIVHEVAHQWWYNLVGNDVFDSPWMDEALATYTSGLYFEETVGSAQGMVSSWRQVYEEVVARGQDAPVAESLSYYEEQDQSASYGGVVYRKGALFFHELRQEIGDEAFFEALQTYYEMYRYQIARPEDLLDLFEQVSGRQLEDFYQQWLYAYIQ